MFSELRQILKSNTKALDVLYVLEDIKPVARIVHDEELLSFLNDYYLKHTLSDFAVKKITDKSRGYSDKGIIGKEGDKFIYISKQIQLAEKAKRLEAEGNHIELGKLLGYPECCCHFFDKHKDIKDQDFTIKSFENSKGFKFSFELNNCLRGFDISLISHFPCSFNCVRSRQIAERNLKVINEHNSDLSLYFKSALKTALIYSKGLGVHSLREFSTKDTHIEYSPKNIISSAENDFSKLLKQKNILIVTGKNSFVLGDHQITDDYTFFGMFN